MSAIIRAYLPEGTDHSAIQKLMLAHGGYTKTAGVGVWDSGSELVEEPVVVYECVAQGFRCPRMGAINATRYAGRVFLNDNRTERAFLGVVISDIVMPIYLEQTA